MKYEFKGTPGPWRWNVNPRDKSADLSGGVSGGIYVMYTHSDVMFFSGDANKMKPAADLIDERSYTGYMAHSINHPDAKLIVSSPDLLEALISLLDMTESYHCQLFGVDGLKEIYNQIEHPIVEARTAIEKALNIKQ